MNVLLVYAHPEPTSFTCALKETARDALTAAGYHVEVSDLYGEGFNPVAGRHDFVTTHDAGRFHYQNEQGHAHANGKRFDSGFFKDKTGLLCLTTGGTVERFSAGNVYGPIDQVLYPTQHLMVEYLGMKSHPPFVAYAAPRINAEGREAYLQQWRERVLEIAEAVPSAA